MSYSPSTLKMVTKKSKAPVPLAGYIPANQNIEPIIKQTQQEVFLERIFKFGKLVTKQNSAVGPTLNTAIYIVPKDKTFFLTNVYVSQSVSTGSSASDGATIYFDGLFETIVSLATQIGSTGANALSLNFPIPIKLESGISIVLNVPNANMAGSGGITGFEIDSIFLK